jgi:hypothetical protein
MNIGFINEEHRSKYEKLTNSTDETWNELIPLLYIVSGNKSLYKRVGEIYDFEENKPKPIRGSMWSSSEKAMVKLALQLYNYSNNKQNVIDTFSRLDQNNFQLAVNAIKIRFNM